MKTQIFLRIYQCKKIKSLYPLRKKWTDRLTNLFLFFQGKHSKIANLGVMLTIGDRGLLIASYVDASRQIVSITPDLPTCALCLEQSATGLSICLFSFLS